MPAITNAATSYTIIKNRGILGEYCTDLCWRHWPEDEHAIGPEAISETARKAADCLYTGAIENHPLIDGIVIACLESHLDYMQSLVDKYGITKVGNVVPGGETGQESIYKGLKAAQELYPETSIVLVHDGVRPLIDEETITKNIESVKQNGSAVTVTPAVETVTIDNNDNRLGQVVKRSRCQIAKAPQSFYLKDLIASHEKAIAEHNMNYVDSASLMQHYGYVLYTVEGKPENIKITTPMDFYIFRAIEDARENSQIFGL